MNAETTEHPIWIDCHGDRMLGIVAEPGDGIRRRDPAVLIAVGGPQYRVGSHRQFTLLARRLALAGYTSLRFDFRGMGDSDGEMRDFETVGDDLRAAVSALRESAEGGARVIIWGMCDAASAAMMFCAEHPNVAGMALVNPWARRETSYAQATLKHYYGRQLTSAAFWKRLFSGEVNALGSIRGFVLNVRRAGATQRPLEKAGQRSDFRAEMARGLRTFRGDVLLITSGNDLTAREFLGLAESDPLWRGILRDQRIHRANHPAADHTFSSAQWRAWAEDRTLAWLDALGA